MRSTSSRRNKSCERPPICSETAPAAWRCASSRVAAMTWPAPTTVDSIPALDSSASCKNLSLLSSLAVRRMSCKRLKRSPALSAITFPRAMTKATGSSSPRTEEVKGEMPSPPVCDPMRCCSATKSSFSVPIEVSAAQKSGTSGRRRGGTVFMSRPKSMYKMPFAKMSWRITSAPFSSATSIGISAGSSGMSERASDGMHLSASGGSGVSCRSLRACVDVTSASSSSGESSSRLAARRSFSRCSSCFPSEPSGRSSSTTR
mmetsp:Transcript_9148/g.30108  ORF Transcript_9148/g.30108 Transcript_9148/m.30108 type:complete len:260 (+) Transcript_9148:875-1654(+)